MMISLTMNADNGYSAEAFDNEVHLSVYEKRDGRSYVFRATSGAHVMERIGFMSMTVEQARKLAAELRKAADKIDMTIPEVVA